MATNRILIDAPAGLIEVEGEKEFVEAQLDKLLPLIESCGFGQYVDLPEESAPETPRSAEAKAPPPVAETNGNKKAKRATNRPPKGHSCADRILELRKDGFFKDQKTPQQIAEGLGKKGWTHNSNQVSAAGGQMFKRGGIFNGPVLEMGLLTFGTGTDLSDEDSRFTRSTRAIPNGLLDPLVRQFEEGLAEYRAGDWEKVGVKAGKFCEIAFTIYHDHATGTFAVAPSKLGSMFHDCQKLEEHNKTKGRSLCIKIPRVLIALYELRNNRAIGHVSSEIDPNHMDAEFYLRGMKWIMAEFVRFFSKLPEEGSRAIVEAVMARTFQIVWQDGDVRRILDPSKSAEQKVLILTYTENTPVAVANILKWSEYSNSSRMRKTVLKGLHKRALIHFDAKADTVQILPTGQRHVEEKALLAQKSG